MIEIKKIISRHQSSFLKWSYEQGHWKRIPAPVKQGYARVMAIIEFNGQILTRHIDIKESLCN